jgi:hypothetical protein
MARACVNCGPPVMAQPPVAAGPAASVPGANRQTAPAPARAAGSPPGQARIRPQYFLSCLIACLILFITGLVGINKAPPRSGLSYAMGWIIGLSLAGALLSQVLLLAARRRRRVRPVARPPNCARCGAWNAHTAKLCARCGTAVRTRQPAAAPSPASGRGHDGAAPAAARNSRSPRRESGRPAGRWQVPLAATAERRIYAAEDQAGAMFRPSWAAWWYLSFLAAWRHMRPRINNRDATAYISHLMRQRWFTAAFPGTKPVAVQLVPGVSWCAPKRDRVIHLGTSSRRTLQAAEWDLLHELAHMLTPDPVGQSLVTRPDADGARQRHGDTWKANYITLVQNMIGNRAAMRLSAAIRPGPPPGKQ